MIYLSEGGPPTWGSAYSRISEERYYHVLLTVLELEFICPPQKDPRYTQKTIYFTFGYEYLVLITMFSRKKYFEVGVSWNYLENRDRDSKGCRRAVP